MHRNEGAIDRVLRVAVGLAVLALTVVGPRSPWGLLGLIPLITGLVGVCPMYRVLHLSTRRADSAQPNPV